MYFSTLYVHFLDVYLMEVVKIHNLKSELLKTYQKYKSCKNWNHINKYKCEKHNYIVKNIQNT